MEKLFERLNLYDILAMICPGGLLLLAILSTGDAWVGVKEIPWIHHILKQTILSKAFCFGCLGLLFSYLLGIALHTFVTLWRAAWEDRSWSLWKQTMYCCYKCRINGIVEKPEEKPFYKMFLTDENTLVDNAKNIDTKKLQLAYFDAQIKAKQLKKESLSTIEQQVAMLRNSFVPCLWLGILALCSMKNAFWSSWRGITIFIAAFTLVSLLIIYAREYKIFAIVLSACNSQGK